MMTPVQKATQVGAILTLAGLAASWITAMMLGGFRFGKLERRIQFTVDRAALDEFLERFYRRMNELGFHNAGPGQFLQGGAGESLGFTHARTRKELIIGVDSQIEPARVELSLRFLDPIVSDSGESAYRDAVLEYVSGRTDVMKVISNRSFSALCSFVGAVCAWLALIGLKAIGYHPLLPVIAVPALANVVTAVQAIIAINQKPAELTGLGLAVAGIAASLMAVVMAAVL